MVNVGGYVINIDMTAYYPIFIVLLSVLFFGGTVILLLRWYQKYLRYKQYQCEIWVFNDEGHLIDVITDDAGIFYDHPTKSKLLYLRKAKTAMNPDNIPYFYRGNKKVIYFLKTGLKNYHFLNPKIKYDKLSLSVGEEDVNWAENAYERSIKVVSTEDLITKLLPYIIWALVIVGSLILMLQILKKLDVIRDVILVAKEIAVANAQAVSGTAIVK